MGRKGHPLAARIKKMMQTDEDVGKIAQATPIMIARALELFLQRLCKNASNVAASRKAKTLTCSHLKAYVASDELMDFLKDTVAKAPDLPPEKEHTDGPKPKRQRTSEPKPRAPKGEGKGRTKRDSADGAAAGAAEQTDAAVVAQPAETTAAPAPPPVAQQVKHENGGSPTAAQAAQNAAQHKLGQGFGGLGAHPFLAARTFGKPGAAKRKAAGSSSPKPQSPRVKQDSIKQEDVKQEDVKQEDPAADNLGAFAQQQQHKQELQQLELKPEAVAAAAMAEVLPGISASYLAGFASHQQADVEEDDYD